jgi:DNA-binding response OmpR family regulator
MVDAKKRILIADDNAAILDSLKIMLEESGYDVEITEDGRTAQNIKHPLPDLMLLDLWMSGMDGRDICKFLKNGTATKHMPIIMISAAKGIEQIAKDSGADDYISKPFQMSHLLGLVSKYTNARELNTNE